MGLRNSTDALQKRKICYPFQGTNRIPWLSSSSLVNLSSEIPGLSYFLFWLIHFMSANEFALLPSLINLYSHIECKKIIALYIYIFIKGKGRLWVLQHCCLEAYCTLTRMSSFIRLQRRCTHQAA